MRRMLYGGLGLLAMSALAMSAANAQKASAEKQLLGVKVMQDWKKVLSIHGQPTRIESGAALTTVGGPQASGAMSGGSGTGLPSLGGMSPMGMSSMGMGTPGMGPMGGMMGSRAMMGGGGGPVGSMGSVKLDDGAETGSTMGGLPMGAMGGMSMGAPAMGPMGGMSMGGMTQQQQQPSGEGEVTWIYDRGQNTYVFLFNKDGKIIQIQSFGYANGGKTQLGITLGDQVAKIYRTYGWPDQIEKSGDSLTLDYSREHHVAFQLVDRHNGKGSRLVGITVALTEPRNPSGMLRMAGFGGSGKAVPAGGMSGAMMGGMVGARSGMMGPSAMSSMTSGAAMGGMRPGMMSGAMGTPGMSMGKGMMSSK